jgi:hypothetical protein
VLRSTLFVRAPHAAVKWEATSGIPAKELDGALVWSLDQPCHLSLGTAPGAARQLLADGLGRGRGSELAERRRKATSGKSKIGSR